MKIIVFCILLAVFACSAVAGDGRFETRYTSVLICAPHYERVWVDPVYSDGFLVQVGYWRDVYFPARYERRLVQVWIPERKGGGSFNLGITWSWRTW